MDDNAVRMRLITRDSLVQPQLSTTKCATQFLSLAQATDAKEAERIFEALDATLLRYEGFLRGASESADRATRECQHYRNERSRIEEDCEASTTRLAEMQEELRQSRLERQHKEEYEHVARLINTMPSREDLEGQKAELEAAVAKLEEEHTAVQDDISRRQKQFRALWRSLRDLEILLEGEEQEDGGVSSLQQGEEEDEEAGQQRKSRAPGGGRVAVEMDDS